MHQLSLNPFVKEPGLERIYKMELIFIMCSSIVVLVIRISKFGFIYVSVGTSDNMASKRRTTFCDEMEDI
jgi:hypothetical protein